MSFPDPKKTKGNAADDTEEGVFDDSSNEMPAGVRDRLAPHAARRDDINAGPGDDDDDDDAAESGSRHPQFLLDDEAAYNALLRENEEKERQLKSLKADPWRFAVAPIFSVLSISNAMQWIAFSPIVNEVRNFFDMNATQVNFLATTYVIAYVAIIFLSCKLYEVTGIKNGLLVAAIANALGSLIKIIALYAWPHAALLYIAQVFNSFTEVLTIATPPLIANRWFPVNERMVANTVMSSALNFGCGIGVLIPTFFVTEEQQEKKHFGNLFWFHFGLCFFMLGMVIFFFPKKPRSAASFAADRQQCKEEERMRLMREAFRRRGSHDRANDGDEEDGFSLPDTPAARNDEPFSHNSNEPHHNHNNNTTGGNDESQQHHCCPAALNDEFPTTTAAEDPTTPSAFLSIAEKQNGSGKRRPSDGEEGLVDRDSLAWTESATSSTDVEVEPVNVFSVVLDCLREARRNYSFVLLMVAAAAEMGLIWAVATVLPQMLEPYGISEGISGWIGFLNLVLGTVVCPFIMPLVERFGRRYKLILCSLSVVLTINMVLLTLLLHFGPTDTDGGIAEDNRYYVIITFICWGGVSGLCQNFMMPLMFEYVVELTFPMAESTSAPALTWAACLTNFLLTLIFGEVLTNNPDENKSLRVFIGATVVTAVGAVALFFTKPMHKRRDYEAMKLEEQARLAEEIAELQGNITTGQERLDQQQRRESTQTAEEEVNNNNNNNNAAESQEAVDVARSD